MKNKYKFWIVISVVVAFTAGLLGGLWGERYFAYKKKGADLARARKDSVHFPSLEQMAQKLGLTAAQQEQIKKIFERNDAKLKELRADMHGQLTKIRAELKNELDGVLTAEQRKKLEETIQDYLLQRKRDHEKRREDFGRQNSAENPKGDMR
jgi:Spy/CpxP family protein refolding chaperone